MSRDDGDRHFIDEMLKGLIAAIVMSTGWLRERAVRCRPTV
jgi:hypothetical protein